MQTRGLEDQPHISRYSADNCFGDYYTRTGQWLWEQCEKITGVSGTSRIRTGVLRILVALLVIYGVKSSFDRSIGSKKILY
jgi:hypothetical protein